MFIQFQLIRALLACITLFVAIGCSSMTTEPGVPRVLMVVAQHKIADVEYLKPRAALEGIGTQIRVASVTRDVAQGYPKKDAPPTLNIQPDLTIDEARVADYDAVVLIGGEGAIADLWDHLGLRRLVKEADVKGKMIAAICAAPVVLARAGLLTGRKATSFPDRSKGDSALRNELAAAGATYVDEVVVVDGRLVTGNGPKASDAFAAQLVTMLGKQ